MINLLSFFKNQYFYLSLIIILALMARLYQINSPIADWHSWRQADTAAVTRNFIKEGFNPLLPKSDDMSGVAEYPIPNLGRFRFVEFPIYNIFVYPFYLFFGVDDKYHRLVSALFSLGSITFLFFLTKRYLGVFIALLSAAIFAFLPFNIFFSRTTLPEPTFLFFSLGMIYFVNGWILDQKKWQVVLGAIFTMISFLIKPWAIFFALPLLFVCYLKYSKIFPPKKYLIFAIICLLPFLLWRLWILQHPEGIPASSWLLNGDGIRFRPAFWWWIISERIGREILGATGAVLFFVGLLIKPQKTYFFHFWALSMFLYFSIFATGNVRHNYYQLIFLPVASVLLALGFTYLITGVKGFIPRFWTIIMAGIFLPLTFYFSWMQVSPFYKINNPAIVEAGKKADQILAKEAVVVTPYNGDTAFLYQTNRSGWPFVAYPINDLVLNYRVTDYVSVSRDPKTAWVMRHFQVLVDNPNYTIVDLTKSKDNFSKDDPEP